MPDPISYLTASVAAAFASAMIVLALRLVPRKSMHSFAAVIGVLAVGVGALTGYSVLQFLWTWPPANALNRFLMIVLPATVVVELLAAVSGKARLPSRDQQLGRRIAFPSRDADRERAGFRILMNSATKRVGSLCAFGFRLALYASVGRILLHDSVYLGDVGSGNPDAWTFAQTLTRFGNSFVVLIAAWSLLCRLSERSVAGSIRLSLAMTILCAGLATMMAGYIKGGAAAIPLAAALAGTSLAFPLLANCFGGLDNKNLQGVIGIGVIGLFSLLCIGHYFGKLTGLRAIVLFLTPLLCWISEFPGLRSRPAWQKSGVRLTAVTIVLTAVLFFSKQDFDRKIAPLLVGVKGPVTGLHLSSRTSTSSSPGFGLGVGQIAK